MDIRFRITTTGYHQTVYTAKITKEALQISGAFSFSLSPYVRSIPKQNTKWHTYEYSADGQSWVTIEDNIIQPHGIKYTHQNLIECLKSPNTKNDFGSDQPKPK